MKLETLKMIQRHLKGIVLALDKELEARIAAKEAEKLKQNRSK